jgi:hypothetical protein
MGSDDGCIPGINFEAETLVEQSPDYLQCEIIEVF